MPEPEEGQLALIRAQVRRARPRPVDPPAERDPVARVVLDVALAHLDRPFDYLVPEPMSAAAVPGARVRVPFAGQQVDGFVLERARTSDHVGRLSRLRRVVSPEPVLDPAVARLARQVADRYAGTLSDVLRLAVPPRHAAAEAAPRPAPAADPPVPEAGEWDRYDGGARFLQHLAAGDAPRAVWTALPGPGWADALATAVAAALAGGRGALVVVPDTHDVARVDAALLRLLGAGRHVVLTAELGPSVRYRRWLAVRRGDVRAVVGTRAAAFAPVQRLGLVVCWDDGDDLHAEPRAPYPHAREVLLLRSLDTGSAALVGGRACTAEGAQLLGHGWARPLVAPRDAVRAAAPRVRTTGDDVELARDEAARAARLPSLAWRTAHEALASGPVLVQVPRAGYVPSLACATCRAPARCPACHGPLGLPPGGRGAPGCRWCGAVVAAWACPACGRTRLRAAATGSLRTAEELGRAFPGTAVRTSDRDGVLTDVPATSALVVATPGAEPVAEGGYAAALLLDGAALLERPAMRAGEEALRRWLAAAALVRPAAQGGTVVIVAPPDARAVQALVRWDPLGHAERELADRVAAHLPPVGRLVELTGAADDVADLLELVHLPPGTDVVGSLPVEGDEERRRALLRAPRRSAAALSEAVRGAQGVRSARKQGGPVRVRVDPVDLG